MKVSKLLAVTSVSLASAVCAFAAQAASDSLHFTDVSMYWAADNMYRLELVSDNPKHSPRDIQQTLDLAAREVCPLGYDQLQSYETEDNADAYGAAWEISCNLRVSRFHLFNSQ